MKHLHTVDIYEPGYGPATDPVIDEYGGQTEGQIDSVTAVRWPGEQCTITPNASRARQTSAGVQPEGEFTGFFRPGLAGYLNANHRVLVLTGPAGTPRRLRVTTIGDWGSNEGWDLEVGLAESQEDFGDA